MKRKKLMGAIIVLVLVMVVLVSYQYNKPERNVAGEKAIALDADQLYRQYAADEKNANNLYLNKALQVTGTVAGTKHTEQGQYVLVLSTNDPMFGVSCTMSDTAINTGSLRPGDKVTVKGICTGYLTDVILIRAALVQ